jgi:hypothetical protein
MWVGGKGRRESSCVVAAVVGSGGGRTAVEAADNAGAAVTSPPSRAASLSTYVYTPHYNGPRRAHCQRCRALDIPLDLGLPHGRRLLGSDDAVHEEGCHQLHSPGAPVALRPQQLVAEEEGPHNLVCRCWCAEQACLCSAFAAQRHRQRVVLHTHWKGW